MASSTVMIDESIGGHFARVVAHDPQKIAIDGPGIQVRFADLDFASRSIAGWLIAAHAHSPGRVALLFDDPAVAIGAMLGVLRAGHSYVILDARDPAARLRFIVNDCDPFILLTDEAHLGQAHGLVPSGCDVVCVTSLPPLAPEISLPVVSADATTYLFYTSGSTGRPKGVCQTHRNLLHFIRCYAAKLHISDADRLSLLFSLSFSASNMHIYSALLSGAAICPYDTRKSGVVPLADWLDTQRVSILHTVPTVLRRLAAGLDAQRVFRTLRAIDAGGEALFENDVRLWRQHLPAQAILVNHLGATEANVIAQHIVDRESAGGESPVVPVGRSPEGVRVTIRRADGTEAAVDEVGEITVSSPYLSPGYWRRPRLNAAAFADDPDRPGWRVLRSGDLGRMTAAHELVFLGRRGSRVKLRGQSVDLHEVEAGLRQCKEVTDAVALAPMSGDRREAERLIAYVVANAAANKSPRRLRLELAAHLPDYMLPSAFVFMDALPRTATGKIDRRALSQMQPPSVAPLETFEPPRDELEARIAAAFEKILQHRPVGRGDDFFLTGGDSMSIVELNILLVNLFGSSVPGVFQDTTVAGIAETIRRHEARPSEDRRLMPVLLPRRIEGTPPILFLVHGRRGQAHVGTRLLDSICPEQPLCVFQARGVDGIQEPHQTVGAMAADYVAAMMSVQPQGPYFIGGLCSGGYVALKMAHILRSLGEEVGPIILVDPPVPPLTARDAAKNLRTLGAGLRALQRRGNIEIDFQDPNRRKGAIQVATSFERALVQDRPIPYGGPVYLLASREKLTPAGWGSPEKLKLHFSGSVQCFEVGERHVEILDANNEDFARHLAHCVKSARNAMSAPRSNTPS
jgi:amino acid adenylation domain-containing protein